MGGGGVKIKIPLKSSENCLSFSWPILAIPPLTRGLQSIGKWEDLEGTTHNTHTNILTSRMNWPQGLIC